MTEPDRNEIERLLSSGKLSGGARERIFEQAFAQAVPRRPFWKRIAFVTLAPAVAVACFAVWAVHRAPSDGFRARGTEATTAAIELGCADGSTDRCPAGGVLVARVAELTQPGYFVAWAEGEHGERVWYAPTQSGAPLALATSVAPQMLPDGFRIGPEQPPGHWTVHARVLREMPSRETALTAANEQVLAERVFPLEVTP